MEYSETDSLVKFCPKVYPYGSTGPTICPSLRSPGNQRKDKKEQSGLEHISLDLPRHAKVGFRALEDQQMLQNFILR